MAHRFLTDTDSQSAGFQINDEGRALTAGYNKYRALPISLSFEGVSRFCNLSSGYCNRPIKRTVALDYSRYRFNLI